MLKASMIRVLLVSCLCLAATAALGQSAPTPSASVLPGGTYVFSDFCAGDKGWDISGHRVEFRHWGQDNDTVIIEFSEYGGDTYPIVANRLHFDPATGDLEFVYQTQIDEYAFFGRVTPDKLVGTFEYDIYPTTLPAVPVDSPVKAKCAPR